MNTMKLSFCIVLMLTVVSSASADQASQSIIDFMNVVNGIHTNREQVANDVARNSPNKHLFAIDTMRPVEIPALGQVPLIFHEEDFNGGLARREILLLKESDNGGITFNVFDFTGSFNSGPGQFDVKDLLNLTLQDFTTNPECDINVVLVAPGFYQAHWPDCKVKINGVHPNFTFRWSCSVMEVDVFHAADEEADEAYILMPEGERYPLPSYLGDKGDGYICP